MSSSLINNVIQIYFDSVFGMTDAGMVQMFKVLESSGLRGFLGCSSAIYKAALVEFFQNASVRDDKVVSAVQGKSVEISEELFAGTFELPTEGLTDMHDVPKDLVIDARSAFSMSGEQLKTSCKKREMKFEFRLLNDILAKTVTVKASSFDAVTHERFLMMSAIHGGVKLRRLEILDSVSDIVAKEEQMLQWAETDSLQTAVQRRVHYSKMRQHKLVWTRPSFSRFFEGTNIDRGAVIARSHETIRSSCWIRHLNLFGGSWTVVEGFDRWPVQDLDSRPPFSGRWGWIKFCRDIVQFSIFGHLQPVGTVNLCRDIVEIGIVLDIKTDPTEFVGIFRRGLDVILPSSSSSSRSSQPENHNSSSSSSSSDSPMHFTADDIPQIEEKTAVIPQTSIIAVVFSSIDYSEAIAHLQATVDQISMEQVPSRFHVEKLKVALSKRISTLETAFLMAPGNHDRAAFVQTDILRKEMQDQKVALSKEFEDQMAAIRNDFLEFHVETQENYTTLCDHLAEIIAYINRGRDNKKGEVGSSRGPQPPPDDRNRPGSGNGGRGRGSSSEPSRKRGGGSYGGGGRFRYWFGE
ncbi:hypothetical protein F511_27930 [Dorcoceras hygrometricum]|uniref:Uncharacterized protein n=1 Tax=Dorcoceras hygrometricum TaxID=472368 RepID=A0A2Z7CJK0_9LAMI|nr:hypothetical protein F511_27930 [Dorcoceras hygrometricum]